MPRWSPYFAYPDLSFSGAWTGNSNSDVANVVATSNVSFADAADQSIDLTPGAGPWSFTPMRILQDWGGWSYQITQLFVRFDLWPFVTQRRNDGPDYPYPYPDAQLDGWEREGESGLFHASSKPFAALAAEFNRFRFSFDVTDDTTLDPDLIKDPVDIWVKPWRPSELTYYSSTGFPPGSVPGRKFASAAELNAAGNHVASGGHLSAGSLTTRVTTTDLLPSDFLDTASHPGFFGSSDFLCFSICFAQQATHTPPGGTLHGRSIRATNVSLDAGWSRDRFRFQLRSSPVLRQRQRAAGIGGAAGPSLRQRGALSADQPPLRQRQNR